MEQNSPTQFTAQHEEAFNNLTNYFIQLRPDHSRNTMGNRSSHSAVMNVLSNNDTAPLTCS